MIQGDQTIITHRAPRVIPPKLPDNPKKQHTLSDMLKDAAEIRARHGGIVRNDAGERKNPVSPEVAKLQKRIMAHMRNGEATNAEITKSLSVSRMRVSYATGFLCKDGELIATRIRGTITYRLNTAKP